MIYRNIIAPVVVPCWLLLQKNIKISLYSIFFTVAMMQNVTKNLVHILLFLLLLFYYIIMIYIYNIYVVQI